MGGMFKADLPVTIIVVIISQLVLVRGFPERSIQPVDGVIKLRHVDQVQCDSPGGWVLDLIPDPTGSCQRFYSCVPAESGSGQITKPKEMWCQRDSNGNRLYYDFRSCQCEFQEQAVCFNSSDPEHEKDFFKCTRLVEPV